MTMNYIGGLDGQQKGILSVEAGRLMQTLHAVFAV